MLKEKILKLLSLLAISLIINTQGVEASTIVDINKGESYLSTDYYTQANELVKKYPDILQIKELGYSYDKKPIYSIIMTDNVTETMQREDINSYKMHYLVQAGTHGRETVNTAIIMKLIEDYAIDFYEDSHISGFNVKQELSDSVIHFIPLLNPDGHDLTKIGLKSVKTEDGKQIINAIKDKDYKNWKANLRGVDINRNYPDRYLDKSTKQWVEKWQKYPHSLYSYKPSGSYYPGSYAGSEIETQIMMKYMDSYDFRNYLTFHSRGEIAYFDWFYSPKGYNVRAQVLGDLTELVTGYKLQYTTNGIGSGYDNEYFSANHLKVGVTLETLDNNTATPTLQKFFKPTYDKTYLLPLYFVREGRNRGYYPYRVYVNGVYTLDFFDYDYAVARAEELGGVVVDGIDKPEAFLVQPVTREEALSIVVGKFYDLTALTVDATDTFIDTQRIVPTFAKNIEIVSNNGGYFRPYDSMTTDELAVLLFNIYNQRGVLPTNEDYMKYSLDREYASWAQDSVKFLLYYKYAEPALLETPLVDLKQLKKLKLLE